MVYLKLNVCTIMLKNASSSLKLKYYILYFLKKQYEGENDTRLHNFFSRKNVTYKKRVLKTGFSFMFTELYKQ